MFYALTPCGQHGDGIQLKFTENSLKTLEILYYEVGDPSSKGVAMATRRISMWRHEISMPYNLTPRGLIFSKFHMLVKSPDLNTCSVSYLAKVIAFLLIFTKENVTQDEYEPAEFAVSFWWWVLTCFCVETVNDIILIQHKYSQHGVFELVMFIVE